MILSDTDCKISGEESVKALGNEEKPFGGLERERNEYIGSTVTVLHSVPINEPHSICQSQRKNDVAEMK